ncbi:MAG: hypothetical protein AAF891_02665 [Pseudomonadota bacterium]
MTALFEDFSLGPQPTSAQASATNDSLESFDAGYKAGWDDASKAHGDSQSHASGMLARNIEAMEFTLVEARAMVLDALRPILSEVAQTLLPGLASQSLHAHLVTELHSLIETAAPDQLQIETSLADELAVAALLEAEGLASKATINPRSTLGEGQIYVALAGMNKRIDIPQAIEGIAAALCAFDPMNDHPEQEIAHAG